MILNESRGKVNTIPAVIPLKCVLLFFNWILNILGVQKSLIRGCVRKSGTGRGFPNCGGAACGKSEVSKRYDGGRQPKMPGCFVFLWITTWFVYRPLETRSTSSTKNGAWQAPWNNASDRWSLHSHSETLSTAEPVGCRSLEPERLCSVFLSFSDQVFCFEYV